MRGFCRGDLLPILTILILRRLASLLPAMVAFSCKPSRPYCSTAADLLITSLLAKAQNTPDTWQGEAA